MTPKQARDLSDKLTRKSVDNCYHPVFYPGNEDGTDSCTSGVSVVTARTFLFDTKETKLLSKFKTLIRDGVTFYY